MVTMGTKLNGYILTEELKKKMRDTLLETQQTKVEMGFTLCSKPDNIIVSRGDHSGESLKIKIDSEVCEKDEKFLGGYHTHFGTDSSASATDLRYCGTDKTTCIGGDTDNKIMCYIWKYEQQSLEESNKMVDSINKGMTKYENPKYQPAFDCIRAMNPLFLGDIYVRENLDKDLKETKSRLLVLKKTGKSKHEITKIENEIKKRKKNRDKFVDELYKEVKDESKKYYNEVEIK